MLCIISRFGNPRPRQNCGYVLCEDCEWLDTDPGVKIGLKFEIRSDLNSSKKTFFSTLVLNFFMGRTLAFLNIKFLEIS
jgi:hypothetical protein